MNLRYLSTNRRHRQTPVQNRKNSKRNTPMRVRPPVLFLLCTLKLAIFRLEKLFRNANIFLAFFQKAISLQKYNSFCFYQKKRPISEEKGRFFVVV